MEAMTTPQKAAIEALEKLAKLMPVRPKAITYDLGTEILNCVQDDLEQHIPAILTTLRDNQGCAVVTVEEITEMSMRKFPSELGRWLLNKLDESPNGLVIAPEKKET